jgi:hypothetical protein
VFPQRTSAPKRTNHIAILIDRSGSTHHIADQIRDQFNQQAKLINAKATETDQVTHLSLYTFSDVADHPLLFEVPLGLVSLNSIKKEAYNINGSTALLDCVGRAVEDLSQFHKSTTGDHSFLLITLTDGQENNSVTYGLGPLYNRFLSGGDRPADYEKFNKLMKEKIATDAWTFAFLVPKGDKAPFVNNFGVLEGCIQEWDTTAKGLEIAGKQAAAGISNYYAARAQGKRSVTSFFTDIAEIPKSHIRSTLTDLTSQFYRRLVPKEMPIKEFAIKEFGNFAPGKALYELTKREEIQDYKQVIIEDKATSKLYGGDEGRKLIGLPSAGTIKVSPGAHGDYRIFVQSTSVNRKLVRGTTLLYSRS